MVYLKKGYKLGTVARIKKIKQLTNSILELTVNYKTTEPKTTAVRFVGNCNEKAKTLKEGDVIALLMQYNPAERIVYAIDFAKEGNYFTTSSKETVIFAKPMKGEKSVRFYLQNSNFPFHEVSLDTTIDTEKVALVVAKNGKMRMTPKGKSLVYYDECVSFGQFIIKPQLNDILISVGVYENHPIKASELLNVPEADKKRVLEWMAFAADSWNPPDVGNLRAQKAAITAMLESYKAS